MRRTDYLFQRPGSRNWHVKLQSPTGRVERSLGTPDRVQAEILALPMIAEHKVKLLEARSRLETIWKHDYEPDREHIGPDGDRVIAADRELIHLDSEGRITRRSPNGGLAYQLVGRQKLTVRSLAEAYTEAFTGVRPRRQERTADDGASTRPKAIIMLARSGGRRRRPRSSVTDQASCSGAATQIRKKEIGRGGAAMIRRGARQPRAKG